MIGHGLSDQDFATLVMMQAKASGIELQPENAAVGDGLSRAMPQSEDTIKRSAGMCLSARRTRSATCSGTCGLQVHPA